MSKLTWGSNIRALSIRQPYAELILRGIKTVEYRTTATKIIGQRFHIYASLTPADDPRDWTGLTRTERRRMWGGPVGSVIPWWESRLETLPTGVIVGSAVITHCTKLDDSWAWRLADVRRPKRPRRPRYKPQPRWFDPF